MRSSRTGPDRETFVAEAEGRLLGTYYLRANQRGGGAHVANCGYVTARDATGRGVARRNALAERGPSVDAARIVGRRRSLRARTARLASG